MNVPEDLQYASTHEWLRLDGAEGTVGITDHAQAELTDVVYVELPKVGAQVTAGQQVCVVESVKAASDLYAPIAGRLVRFNEELLSDPSAINLDKYGAGWLFEIEGSSESLLAPAGYIEHLTAVWEVTQRTIKGQMNE